MNSYPDFLKLNYSITMTEKITLRPATIHDLETLKHWDTQPHVLDSDPNDDWNWEVELQKDEPWREQLIAELDNRPDWDYFKRYTTPLYHVDILPTYKLSGQGDF